MTDNPYSSPVASVDTRPRTRRSKESGNEGYFKTARAHLVLGCLSLFVVLALLVSVVLPGSRNEPDLGMLMWILFAMVTLVCAGHFLVWWGAKQRKGWARILSIIYGVISLPGFPVSTVIGIYLIVVAWSPWKEPEYYEHISLEGWPGQTSA